MQIHEARWPDDKPAVQTLFREYADSLGVDLCFQNFAEELSTLPGKYARPGGLVLLARDGAALAAVGCYRPFETGCEMKRLYVRPQFRGRNAGRLLARALIDAARAAGHAYMVLDSLPDMRAAQALYSSLGFVETVAYYANPIPGSVYMRLDLQVPSKPHR